MPVSLKEKQSVLKKQWWVGDNIALYCLSQQINLVASAVALQTTLTADCTWLETKLCYTVIGHAIKWQLALFCAFPVCFNNSLRDIKSMMIVSDIELNSRHN